MKRISNGIASLLPTFGKHTDQLEPLVLSVYNAFMGKNSERLPAIRFQNSILTIAAKNTAWKKEGISNRKQIIDAINKAMDSEVVKEVRFVVEKIRGSMNKGLRQNRGKKDAPLEVQKAAESISNEKLKKAFIQFGTFVCGAGNTGKRDTEQG